MEFVPLTKKTRQQKTCQVSEEEDLLQFDGQRDGIEEDINLEDEEEKEPKVFKHLRKEIPEEADVGGQVWY